jgi:uncharacterized protein YecT (DUF1311 family)/ankyrin repeat protein
MTRTRKFAAIGGADIGGSRRFAGADRDRAPGRRRAIWFIVVALALWPSLAAAEDAPGPSFSCGTAKSPIDKLICSSPGVAKMDALLAKTYRDAVADAAAENKAALATAQQQWADGRVAACPAIKPDASKDEREEAADCLERIYEQRAAVLQRARMEAAWPKVPFRPTLAMGGELPVCKAIRSDLEAAFFGSSLRINPLGEREIDFAVMPGVNEPADYVSPLSGYRRADFDPFNTGKPVPVLVMIGEGGALRYGETFYRRTTKAVLDKMLADRDHVHAGYDAIGDALLDRDTLTVYSDRAGRFVRFIDQSVVVVPAMPRFFRFDGKVYLFNPGVYYDEDGGVYSLDSPSEANELCLFKTEPATDTRVIGDNDVASAEFAAVERAAAPLLPHGQLCLSNGEAADTLTVRALYRPWSLEAWPNLSYPDGPEQFDRYMRNRGLTGLERHRQWLAYEAARDRAVAAVTRYYATAFGRDDGETKRLAAVWIDRHLYDDGFAQDAGKGLFAADFADKHAAAVAAFAGDVAALKAALGGDPKAAAARPLGPSEEPLTTDALEHPDLLKSLLAMGFDPDRLGASGRSALMNAVRLNLPQAASVLLDAGAKPNLGAGDAVATIYGNAEDVDVMCQKAGGPPPPDIPGRTALSYAAEIGTPAMVSLLLAHGAAPDRADQHGATPIAWAIDRKDGSAEEIRKLLLPPALFHLDLGNRRRVEGTLSDAETEYRRAIALDGKFAAVHTALGNLLRAKNRFADAAIELDIAVKLDAKDPGPRIGLGNLFAAENKFDEAATEFRAAIALDPAKQAYHLDLGDVLVRQGKLADAVTEFRAAVKIDAEVSAPHLKLANALRAQKKYEDAAYEYREATRYNQADPAPHVALGRMLRELGNNKEADEELQWAKNLTHR